MRLARPLLIAGIAGLSLVIPSTTAAAQPAGAAPGITAERHLTVGTRSVAARPAATERAYDELSRSAGVAGTAWWTDPATGAVVVGVDATVTGAALSRVTTAAERAGARVVREPDALARRIAGGDPFYGGVGGRCTIGFNVRQGSIYYFLTSAHCVGPVGTTVYADPSHLVILGVVTSVDAGHDYALVRYTNTSIAKPSAVNVHGPALQPITSVAAGFVGQPVRRSGMTTGVRSGTITGLNATVNYSDGVVTGLIRTNVCAEAGDSGGPLFAASTALGMTSGGSGNCTSGGVTYFSSAARAMSQYAVSVY